MMANKRLRVALHLLLAMALALPGLVWGQQHASATGTQWRDITGNTAIGSSGIYAAADGKLYLVNELNKQILVRGSGDAAWEKLADLPANQFTSPYKLAIRDGVIYVIDRGSMGNPPMIPSKIMKSIDNGEHWTEVAAPADGYSNNGSYLTSIFFDAADNMYVVDYYGIFKLDANNEWTRITPKPDDSSFAYRFTSAAVDRTGKLYATILKMDKYMPTFGQTAALYSYDNTNWNTVNVTLPGVYAQLTVAANGDIRLAQGTFDFFSATFKHIYEFDGTVLATAAFTDSGNWTTGGIAFDGTYYYILDYTQNGTIRTDNPTFGIGKTPPTLIADSTDNDTEHQIELTFADDEDWRNAITAITVTRNGTAVAAQSSASAGKITIAGLNTPGSYQIKVKATGYQETSVAQDVELATSVWHDIKANLGLPSPLLSYDQGKIYATSIGSPLYYRSVSDNVWHAEEWQQGQFGVVFGFAAMNGIWYAADLYMNTSPMTTRTSIMISSDHGESWTPYQLPTEFTMTGAMNQITVDMAGKVYLFDGKTVFVLDENRVWSAISAPANDADGYQYSITGAAADASGSLYANIRKSHSLYPNNNTAKLYKYTTTWEAVADSPTANMQLYSDANGVIHAGTVKALLGESPDALLYRIVDEAFVPSATLDSMTPTHYAIAYGDGYYYSTDINFPALHDEDTMVRTTNPNYSSVPTYKITYNGNASTGGVAPTDSHAYETGGTATVAGANTLSKTGYTFAGWNTETTGGGTPFAPDDTITIEDENVTLYAQWTANPYTVTFDAGAGTVSPATQNKLYDGTYGNGADGVTSAALPTPERTGYTFGGWYTQAGGAGTPVTDTTAVTTAADHTLYAKWLVGSYTVTFDALGGTVTPATQTKQFGSTYGNGADGTTVEALPTPERSGYAFDGWHTQVGGTGAQVTDTTEMSDPGNHTLYAKWTPKTYSIAFNSNEGSAVDAVQADFDTTIAAPNAPTRTGYRFAGWYKESSLTNAWRFATDKVPVDGTTLFAKWTKVYSITYDGNSNNSGSAPAEDRSYAAGETATVLDNTGELARSGLQFAGWNTLPDGSGETYQAGASFVIGDEDVTLYAKWNSPPPSIPSTTADASGAEVSVNGKKETAGKAITTTGSNGKRTTTIEVDETKLEQRLAAAGDRSVVTIAVNSGADNVVGELNGRMVKNMETRQATVEIHTGAATYTLPAQEINIDAISARFGKQIGLQDIKVRIEITTPSGETAQIVSDAATDNGLSIVVPPIDFTVKAVYGDITVDVTQFNAYIKREIALPQGVDASKITTGIVVEADGTVRHVPTKIVQRDGVYYAAINSLTNSTYAVVWHPLAFADVAAHWAQDAVNDLGSRMVAEGLEDGLFHPDQKMTRAEFAAVLVRALGLNVRETGKAPFGDIDSDDGYNGAIATAAAYGLIGGFDDGSFRPDAVITREQAMKMLAGAMAITGLQAKLPPASAAKRLSAFSDAEQLAAWARDSAALTLEAGIVNGRNGGRLAAKAAITRAEAVVMIERLLKASDLI